MGLRPSATDLFAFLAKAIEVVVIGGVYLIAVFIFVSISLAMFDALGLGVIAGGGLAPFLGAAGLVPVVAVASLYDPRVGPAEQEFGRGLSKMVALLPRLLSPLTLVVLVVYLLVIPFNFMAPFEKREVLVVYNGMLFAIMALLIGATPLRDGDLSPRYRRALRSAIRVVAALVVLVSLYALSATVYRAVQGRLDDQPVDDHRLEHHQHRPPGAAEYQAIPRGRGGMGGGATRHVQGRRRRLTSPGPDSCCWRCPGSSDQTPCPQPTTVGRAP